MPKCVAGPGVAGGNVVALSRIETLSGKKLTTARSGLLSPLKSPATMAWGEEMGLIVVKEVKLPAASFIKVVTELSPVLMAARSRYPSPLKSPVTTAMGALPTGKGLPEAATKSPIVSSKKTLTELLLPPSLATAMPGVGFPCPSLKMPAVIPCGEMPVVIFVAVAKLTEPGLLIFRKTLRLLLAALVTARSGLLSWLKSKATSEFGTEPPVEKKAGTAKPPMPSPSRMATLFCVGLDAGLMVTARS